MNEKEMELLLSSKIQSCVTSRCLPDGFAERMVAEVRRSKRMRRFRTVTVSVAVIVLSSALMGLLSESPKKEPRETALIAARENGTKEKVTSWIFLGFFKECIKRNRTNKRKEEY
jgi:hypothetical protein